MIRIENVSKDFNIKGSVVKAVDNVTLDIAAGEIYGIIGFSGAGKSTLVRCINLLERPSSGKVFVSDKEITALKPDELRVARKKIGMIFQHFNLMPSRSVEDNVAYPLYKSGLSKKEIKEKVLELLALVDISDKANAYPSQLSGGQKQRVAIARALANDPNVLLCDEATSALDPQTTKAILSLLKKLNKKLGLTIVIITHEMAVVKEVCDKVAVMENGKIVENGTVFSIFANPTQPVTRDFIHTTSNLHKIEDLIKAHSSVVDLKEGELVARLSYIESNTSEPLISATSRKFHIDFNIIYADVEIIGDAPIGGTVAILSGERDNIIKAISYLQDKNVKVEVIKDARNSY